MKTTESRVPGFEFAFRREDLELEIRVTMPGPDVSIGQGPRGIELVSGDSPGALVRVTQDDGIWAHPVGPVHARDVAGERIAAPTRLADGWLRFGDVSCVITTTSVPADGPHHRRLVWPTGAALA